LKHKDTYKTYTKIKKSKQEDFYNEHTAEIILFESAKKYLKEHLGESKNLAISKWKSEVATLKKEKDPSDALADKIRGISSDLADDDIVFDETKFQQDRSGKN
jgi:nucleoside diphosphate kinase